MAGSRVLANCSSSLVRASSRALLRALGAVCLVGTLSTGALAQAQAETKDAKPAAKPQSAADAEAAAAMERARRLASNPMRIILEVGT